MGSSRDKGGSADIGGKMDTKFKIKDVLADLLKVKIEELFHR